LSEETNVCLHDLALVESLEATFLSDLGRCQKIELSDWRRRGAWQRTKELFASLIEDQV
jgi:phosphatidylserine/phosphatidylglycerophosphate/cardiolipin synthase-like enzyme